LLDDLAGRRLRSPAERAAVFAAPPRGTLEERWHVYTSGYRARLVEALENDYPATRRILGEDAFRSLAARYVRRHAPRSHDIGRAGDRLASFLDSDALTRELPFLPDLARFEWMLAEAFVARDGPPLAWGELAGLGPEAVAQMSFRLRPGVSVIRSAWPLFDLRSCLDLPDEAVSIPVEGRPCNAVVYRSGLEVRRRAVDDAEARLLERAREGLRPADLAKDGKDQTEVDRLVERFRFWVAEGVFDKPGTSAVVP
jgi:hypothetical protein